MRLEQFIKLCGYVTSKSGFWNDMSVEHSRSRQTEEMPMKVIAKLCGVLIMLVGVMFLSRPPAQVNYCPVVGE